MFEIWIILGAVLVGLIGGYIIKRWMDNLTPIQKYVKMADKAKKFDREAWEKFEKDIYTKHKDREKKGLTSILW